MKKRAFYDIYKFTKTQYIKKVEKDRRNETKERGQLNDSYLSYSQSSGFYFLKQCSDERNE